MADTLTDVCWIVAAVLAVLAAAVLCYECCSAFVRDDFPPD